MAEQIMICTNNRELSLVNTNIDYSWEWKYIGREIIKEEYDKQFDHNGHYFENERFLRYGIVMNLKTLLDEEERIAQISYYKEKDLGGGQGRPQTSSCTMTKSDYAAFSKLLESVTIDYVENEYQTLCNSFSNEEKLPGGYVFENATRSGFVLVSPTGESVKLSKENVKKALIISHRFIDVLYDRDILLQNPQCFEPEDIPVYLAILSKVDFSQYRNLSRLQVEANNRELIKTAKEGYYKLLKAVKENDYSKACDLSKYAKVSIKPNKKDTPLIAAVKNANCEMVKLLVDSGACTSLEAHASTPLALALQKKQYDIIELLAKNGAAKTSALALILQDRDIKARELIKPYIETEYGSNVYINAIKPIGEWTIDDIRIIASIESIKIEWPLSLFKMVYESDRTLSLHMLAQGCERGTLIFLIEHNDFEAFCVCVKKEAYVPRTTSIYSLFSLSIDWYNTIKEAQKTCKNLYGYLSIDTLLDDYIMSLLRTEKFDEYLAAKQKFNVNKSLKSYLEYISVKDCKDIKATAEFLITEAKTATEEEYEHLIQYTAEFGAEGLFYLILSRRYNISEAAPFIANCVKASIDKYEKNLQKHLRGIDYAYGGFEDSILKRGYCKNAVEMYFKYYPRENISGCFNKLEDSNIKGDFSSFYNYAISIGITDEDELDKSFLDLLNQ